MRPVARWQLMMALTLSVPCADWFTPCEKQVTAFYPDAEVTIQKTPEIWPKGKKLVGYNMLLKKPYYFPLRYY